MRVGHFHPPLMGHFRPALTPPGEAYSPPPRRKTSETRTGARPAVSGAPLDSRRSKSRHDSQTASRRPSTSAVTRAGRGLRTLPTPLPGRTLPHWPYSHSCCTRAVSCSHRPVLCSGARRYLSAVRTASATRLFLEWFLMIRMEASLGSFSAGPDTTALRHPQPPGQSSSGGGFLPSCTEVWKQRRHT